MGAVIKLFHDDDTIQFDNSKVRKFVNIWSPQDVVGDILGIAIPTVQETLALTAIAGGPEVAVTSLSLMARIKNRFNLNATGHIHNNSVENVEIDIAHDIMWYHVDTVRAIRTYYEAE